MTTPTETKETESIYMTSLKGWLSTVFLSLLIVIMVAGSGGLLVGDDDNGQAFVVFIALATGSIFLSRRFPEIITFRGTTLSWAALAVSLSAALSLIPAAGSGSIHLAPFLAYGYTGRMIFVVFLCILLPVIEEAYFRGLLYPILSKYLGYGAGAIITITLFTLGHSPSLKEVLLIAASGSLYTWLAHRSRSLIPAILAHSAGNSIWLMLALRSQ